MHRDVKPSKLTVAGDGTVKLLDLGLAKAQDDPQNNSLTVAHESVLGTVITLAEQRLDSHAVDPRADIYPASAARCIFCSPADHRSDTGSWAKRPLMHQTQFPPGIELTGPDAPDRLLAVCRRMISKSPVDRYQSAAGGEKAPVLAHRHPRIRFHQNPPAARKSPGE